MPNNINGLDRLTFPLCFRKISGRDLNLLNFIVIIIIAEIISAHIDSVFEDLG